MSDAILARAGSVREPSPALLTAAAVAVIGALLLAEPTEGFVSLLTGALFILSLSLGGAIFIAIQAVAGARWWYPIRNVPLLLIRGLPLAFAALVVVFAFGLSDLYPWADSSVVSSSALLQEKSIWLNAPFFLARAILVFVAWLALTAALREGVRVLSDPENDAAAKRLVRRSALFLVALGPTLSIAGWDWAMSLEPEWFSTMYGVYLFSGFFQAGIAAVAVLCLTLDPKGSLPFSMSDRVQHDLGKLLFAFSCFWAYIWFCQYLLIWYTNIPEEATYFVARQTAGWSVLFWLNPIFCFVVPFLFLMSAKSKKNAATLFQVAVAVLIGRWLDTYLMVGPAKGALGGLPLPALVGTGALLVILLSRLRQALDHEGSETSSVTG